MWSHRQDYNDEISVDIAIHIERIANGRAVLTHYLSFFPFAFPCTGFQRLAGRGCYQKRERKACQRLLLIIAENTYQII